MSRHSGQSVTTFFSGLFSTIIGVGTLGSTITFSYVLNNKDSLADTESYFNKAQVQRFLATSWLLFLLDMAFAAIGSTIMTFFRAHWIKDWNGEHGRRSQREVQLYAVVMSALMAGLTVAAFIFLCLVVVAYEEVVGWIALGFTCCFGFMMLVSVIYQYPWPWKDNSPDMKNLTPL